LRHIARKLLFSIPRTFFSTMIWMIHYLVNEEVPYVTSTTP
jgi:hypothetical protein